MERSTKVTFESNPELVKTKLWEYIIAGRLERFETIMKCTQFPVNEPITQTGIRCLHQAVLSQRNEFVKLLIEIYNADVNVTDEQGKTALHLAAASGNEEAVDYLIQQGANVNAKTQGSETAVMKAVQSGLEPLARKLLLNYKCDVTVKNNQNKTVFDLIMVYMGKEKLNEYMDKLRIVHANMDFSMYVSSPQSLPEIHRCIRNICQIKSKQTTLQALVDKIISIRGCPMRSSSGENHKVHNKAVHSRKTSDDSTTNDDIVIDMPMCGLSKAPSMRIDRVSSALDEMGSSTTRMDEMGSSATRMKITTYAELDNSILTHNFNGVCNNHHYSPPTSARHMEHEDNKQVGKAIANTIRPVAV
jgi:hypothetical protein